MSVCFVYVMRPSIIINDPYTATHLSKWTDKHSYSYSYAHIHIAHIIIFYYVVCCECDESVCVCVFNTNINLYIAIIIDKRPCLDMSLHTRHHFVTRCIILNTQNTHEIDVCSYRSFVYVPIPLYLCRHMIHMMIVRMLQASTYHDNDEKITSLNHQFGVSAACVTRTKVL